MPGSLIPYFGPAPAGDVGPIYGTPDQWINGLDYEVWQAGGYEGTPCFPFTCTNYKGKTRTGTSVSFSGGPSSGSIGDTHTGSTVNYAGGSVPFYFGHVHTGSSVSHIGGAPWQLFWSCPYWFERQSHWRAPGSYFGHVHTGSSVSHIGRRLAVLTERFIQGRCLWQRNEVIRWRVTGWKAGWRMQPR